MKLLDFNVIKNKPVKLHLFLLVSFFSISCSEPKEETNSTEVVKDVDAYLKNAIELHNIPGLALAVVKGDEVLYENYFGVASLNDSSSVTTNTLFRIYSATKLITTTGVFQLIENEELKLNDKISTYLDSLPAAWQDVRIKNLLSHSSGLPDIIRYESTLTDKELMEKLAMDGMEFATGSQFRYNQTNYWLLARIIEKITGMSFDEYILKNQFENKTRGVLFSSNSQETIPGRAIRYIYSGKNKKFVKGTNNSGVRGHSGNGLNINLKSFIEWDKKLKNNMLLKEKTKSLMWSPFNFQQNFKYQKDHFLHGWHNYHVNGLDSYGFTGGNLSAYRYFPKYDTSIILLSNGYQIEAYDILVNDIARLVLPDLRTKKLVLEEEVMDMVLKGEYLRSSEAIAKLKGQNPNSLFDNLKMNINGVANSFVWNEEPEKALEVFKLNAEANPDWWIALAGLAEIYEIMEDNKNAVKYYQEALMLNEKNEYNYNGLMQDKIKELKK
ncbi:serine hydrolase [Maribacter aurantiacus]|uniref:Serine hydrolase n=1 Tax=Maribacter aurantiacus TaxID=1882343 RepID=A0A5R8M6X5_9FLAO|nr:serine hydrolase [Maribacter aurantiacus]TLF45297.1 serine hydrolase [Maribacter aurantiacus]